MHKETHKEVLRGNEPVWKSDKGPPRAYIKIYCTQMRTCWMLSDDDSCDYEFGYFGITLEELPDSRRGCGPVERLIMFMRVARHPRRRHENRLGDLLDDVPSPDGCTRHTPCSTPAPERQGLCYLVDMFRGTPSTASDAKECEHLEVRGGIGLTVIVERAGSGAHIRGTN
jgi:hypothetical protein